MALGHGSSSSKKHRKSRREGSAEESTKPIKSFIQVFWRRHSSAATSNTEKPAEPSTRTLSPNHKSSAPAVSSLEQALRIARGQVEEEVFPVANEQVSYQSPSTGFLPRIPEYGEGTYTAAQVERLKAGVVRRTNSRSDRSEFNSAPPGIYWPDGETGSHAQAPPFGLIDRLPRIAPLSRPTSSVFFGGPRSPVTSFCASPTRAVSPTPFLHRPLPPPPFADRRGDKMSKSFNLGATAGPMWHAVPLKSPTAEIEVVDTAVYSNVKIPVLRMASPPAVGASSTGGHSPAPMRVHSQSPPPPRQLMARDHRHRQQGPAPHISPVAELRRNPSPRQQQQQTPSSHSASPALSNSPSFSNCPVVLQGNTQISHHPASPFAPITRVTPCGGRTSPPAASSRSASDVTTPVCSQVHRPSSPLSEHHQRVLSSCTGKGLLPRQAPPDSTGGRNEEAKLEGLQQASGGPRSSRRQKDLVATYEEAWDVKMSRRLGGMDVSRLAEGLPNGNSSNFKRFDLVRSSDRPVVTPTSVTVMRSPSLSPVLTSTEDVKLRDSKPASRTTFRNSSNDTIINREIVVSPFRLKQNRVASPTVKLSVSPNPRATPPSSSSEAPVTDYDYAYNRSWSMGVQLNLSLNLASNYDSSADQTTGAPTSEKPSTSPPPPPPHRSASIMTPTTTQFSPSHSPTLMRHQRPHDVIASASPTASRARGVHNPLASGVPLTPSSPSGESSSTVKGDTSDTSGGGTVPGLLPHMSRLLADWDNMSTDSCEEPWDVRQGKVISQLTRSRFIDPSEVLSAVANGNHNGAATISNGHEEGRSTKGAEAEGVVPSLPPPPGISPPTSCASPVARSPSDSTVEDCLKPLSEQPWFHPNLTRVAAEKRLRSEPEGSFLVRNSETIKNEFSLTVKHNGFLHMRITRDAQGQFVLGEYSQPYPSIPHMISHYEQTQVPVKGADSVTLFHPR